MGDTFKAIGLNIGRIFNSNFGVEKTKSENFKIDKNMLFKKNKSIRFTKNNDRGDLYSISLDLKNIGSDMLKVLKK